MHLLDKMHLLWVNVCPLSGKW